MAGFFGSAEPANKVKSIVPDVKALALPEPPRRSSEETASLAAQQTDRFTRRKGRAVTMLTGGEGTSGGVSVGRMLGSVART